MGNAFRSFLKILVLLLCLTAAVAGIMVFYGSVVSAPRLPEVRNSLVLELEDRIDGYDGYSETAYETVKDAIGYYAYEKKVSRRERDGLCSGFFYRKYAPLMVAHCVESLSSHGWKDASVDFFLGRVDTLTGMRLYARDGYVVPSDSDVRADLDTLKSLLLTYRHVLDETREVEYRPGIDVSLKRIQALDSCLAKVYGFRTCSGTVCLGDLEDLSSASSAFRASLKKAHYSYLVKAIGRIGSPSGFSGKTEFEDFSSEVLEDLEAFMSRGNEVYGIEPHYSPLVLGNLRERFYSGRNSGVASYGPLVLRDVKFGVTNKAGDVLVGFGSLITSPRTRYLVPELDLMVREAGRYEITMEMDTPQGSYRYSSSTGYLSEGVRQVRLAGYGRDEDGNWPAGDYQYRFLCDGKLLGERSFHVY